MAPSPERLSQVFVNLVDNAASLSPPGTPILIDAVLLAETYRGARHPMPFVDELIHSVDALLRELTIAEKAKEFADA